MGDNEAEGLIIADGFGDRVFMETPVDGVIVKRVTADITMMKTAFRMGNHKITIKKSENDMPLAKRMFILMDRLVKGS